MIGWIVAAVIAVLGAFGIFVALRGRDLASSQSEALRKEMQSLLAAQSQAEVQRLETEAEDLYQLGYGELTTDPSDAAKKLRQVLDMTGSGSEYHTKAAERLKQLSSGGSQ